MLLTFVAACASVCGAGLVLLLALLLCRLDSSPNPVPPHENYCFVMLCIISQPVPHAGQGLDDVTVAGYVNVFTYEYVTLLRDTF